MSVSLTVLVLAGAVLAVAALVILLVLFLPRRRERVRAVAAPPPERVVVTLPVASGQPGDPVVERLVREAAARAFAAAATTAAVEVRRGDGTLLGVVERHEDLRPVSDLPEHLRATHRPSRSTPRVVRGTTPPRPPLPVDDTPLDLSAKVFADRFVLPAAVRESLADPQDPTELVAALLAAGGHRPRSERRVVLAGDTAIVLVGDAAGHTVDPDALADGFLRFQASGAARGVALCLGYVDPRELHRRELLAPTLAHAGTEAIQRMADALALGGDPLLFVSPPTLG